MSTDLYKNRKTDYICVYSLVSALQLTSTLLGLSDRYLSSYLSRITLSIQQQITRQFIVLQLQITRQYCSPITNNKTVAKGYEQSIS